MCSFYFAILVGFHTPFLTPGMPHKTDIKNVKPIDPQALLSFGISGSTVCLALRASRAFRAQLEESPIVHNICSMCSIVNANTPQWSSSLEPPQQISAACEQYLHPGCNVVLYVSI